MCDLIDTVYAADANRNVDFREIYKIRFLTFSNVKLSRGSENLIFMTHRQLPHTEIVNGTMCLDRIFFTFMHAAAVAQL